MIYSNNYNKEVFLKHIIPHKDNFKTIIEIGSRDGLDTIFLFEYFNCQIHSFEPNPPSFVECVNNISKYKNSEKIKMNNLAVWNESTKIKFFPVINGNHGASSCYTCSQIHPTEKYQQIEIEIDSITLKQYCELNNIYEIDLLVMDAQGSEYNCLIGLGDMLKNVKFIITEAIYKPLYNDIPLNEIVKKFLETNGFIHLDSDNNHPNGDWWGDQIYVNKIFYEKNNNL